jgi:hypothetical protein
MKDSLFGLDLDYVENPNWLRGLRGKKILIVIPNEVRNPSRI